MNPTTTTIKERVLEAEELGIYFKDFLAPVTREARNFQRVGELVNQLTHSAFIEFDREPPNPNILEMIKELRGTIGDIVEISFRKAELGEHAMRAPSARDILFEVKDNNLACVVSFRGAYNRVISGDSAEVRRISNWLES